MNLNKNRVLLIIVIGTLGLAYWFLDVNRGKETPNKRIGGDVSNENILTVATSVYPITFLANRIGGEKVKVFSVLPVGVEPHDFDPTARDIARVYESNIVLLNGAGMEGWAKNIQENVDTKKTQVIQVGDGLFQSVEETEHKLGDLYHEHESGLDPHVWLTPKNMIAMSEKVEKAFIQADAANATTYASNAELLRKELRELHDRYKQQLSQCAQKDIITSHEAFGYLTKEYGLHQHSIAGISPDIEPPAKKIAELASYAKKQNVDVVFFESVANPKVTETLAREIGAKSLTLHTIENLTNEQLSSGENYETLMRANLETLTNALQCPKTNNQVAQ